MRVGGRLGAIAAKAVGSRHYNRAVTNSTAILGKGVRVRGVIRVGVAGGSVRPVGGGRWRVRPRLQGVVWCSHGCASASQKLLDRGNMAVWMLQLRKHYSSIVIKHKTNVKGKKGEVNINMKTVSKRGRVLQTCTIHSCPVSFSILQQISERSTDYANLP